MSSQMSSQSSQNVLPNVLPNRNGRTNPPIWEDTSNPGPKGIGVRIPPIPPFFFFFFVSDS